MPRNKLQRVAARDRSAAGIVTTLGGVFTPTQITGLVAWYDFSDIASLWKDTARTSAVTADGDVILGVTDKSGNGKHLSEATNGPTYKVAIQNSRSVARSAGSKQLSSSLTSTQGYTVYVVGKTTAPANNQYFVDGALLNEGVVHNSSLAVIGIYAGTVLDAAVAAGTMSSFHVISAIFSGTSSLVALDGTATSGPAGTGNTTGTTIFDTRPGGQSVTGDIAELLFYNTAHATEIRNVVEAGLKAKWGTP